MKELEDILSEVWREVGRHTDIRESVEELSALLHPIFHHSGIRVFLVGREEDHVEFVAGTCSRDAPPEHLHHLDRADAEELRQWCEGGQPLSDARRDGTHPADLVPGGCPGERTFTGPLYSERGVPGILLIWWMEPDHTPQRMQGLCRKLLEPFAVALENDRRLKELKALREAAEADKRALLTKLGRRQINDRIVGSEGGLKQVMDRVDLVAESDMPVLILGETGSGKEVIARAIHSRSARQEGPFIRVNCGAIPPELIDSELFGHEKGSFTGATSRRRGWFERADEGTLLLDE
ncbi:MAG: sigma 54-interacting transcriptional regulator, partial [Planctomycetota bacterium]